MQPKLVVIVGETASGKSELAIKLAQKFGGEIICADSRTGYKGLDVGTAKPSAEERRAVRHHLLDVVEPDSKFTAADFKKLAENAIENIASRGKLPIIAGGTGLYMDALVFDYGFEAPADPKQRAWLSEKSVPELQQMLKDKGLPLPFNEQNPRHLMRALETGGAKGEKQKLRPNTLMIGLTVDRETLKRRIERRVDAMLAQGLVREIRQCAGQYGWHAEALKTPACKAFRGYIEGAETLEQSRKKFIKNDLDLAKRQRTWFKRNKSIHWLATPVNWHEAVELVTTFLSS